MAWQRKKTGPTPQISGPTPPTNPMSTFQNNPEVLAQESVSSMRSALLDPHHGFILTFNPHCEHSHREKIVLGLGFSADLDPMHPEVLLPLLSNATILFRPPSVYALLLILSVSPVLGL